MSIYKIFEIIDDADDAKELLRVCKQIMIQEKYYELNKRCSNEKN